MVCVKELEGASSMVLSVTDDVGIRTIMDELMTASKHPTPGIRRVSWTCVYNSNRILETEIVYLNNRYLIRRF